MNRFQPRLHSVIALFALLLTGVAGCAGDDGIDSMDEDLEESDESAESASESALAVPGAWAPPASVIAAGALATHAYDPARGRCTGAMRAGTRHLGDVVARTFPLNVDKLEGYNCRRVRGSRAMSIHGMGRALDVYIPMSDGRADNTLGDPVANWAVEHAAELGVQTVIWDRTIWSVPAKTARPYGGTHPHNDHVHIELTNEAAAQELAWYQQAH